MNRKIEKISLVIIKWGAYFSLLTPLIISEGFFYPYIVPRTIFFRTIVQIIFAAYLILAFFFPKYRPKINALTIAISAFIFISFLSSALGVNWSRSFWSTYERMMGLFTLLHLYLFFLVLSNVFKKRKEWEGLFFFSILIATISLGIAHYFKMDGGLIGNTSFFATYILFNLFFAILLFLKNKFNFLGIISLFLFLGTVPLFLNAKAARAAKGSFLGGVFLLICLLFFFSEKKKFKIIGIILPFILLLVGVYAWFNVPAVEEFVVSNLTGASPESRLHVWKTGWNGFLEKPILGWGMENFNISFARHFNQDLYLIKSFRGEVWFDRSHNTPLDILINSGILGLISYLSIFIVSFVYLIKRKTTVGFTLISLLIAYFIQNLTVFDIISGTVTFFLTLAFINYLIQEEEFEEKKESIFFNNKKRRIIASSLVLILTGLTFYFGNLQPARSAINFSRFQDSETLEDQFYFYKESLKSLKYNNELNRRVAISLMETAFFEEEDQELLEEFLIFSAHETEKNVRDDPLDSRAKIILSRIYVSLYELNSDSHYLRLAEEVLKDCIEVSPKIQQGHLYLSAIYVTEEEYKKALEVVRDMEREGSGWKEIFQYAEYVLYIYKRVGEHEDNISLYEEIVSIYEELVEKHSRRWIFWLDFSIYLFSGGEKERAKEMAEKAIEIRPALKRTEKETLEIILQ